MTPILKPSIWYPNYFAQTILDIDPAVLRQRGVTHIVFDLDKTLVPAKKNDLPEAYVDFLRSLQAGGFTVLLGSNTRRDIQSITTLIDVQAIRPRYASAKPLQSYFARVIAQTGTSPNHIAMVGDHLLHDIIGGNRAGFTTILVRAIHHHIAPVNHGYIRLVHLFAM
jgi:HAD superfamily phosphatase (TIGR01668 family)